MHKSKMGLVRLKPSTSEKARRFLEEFFISKNLFISSTPDGIMVTDTEKAKKCIEKARNETIPDNPQVHVRKDVQ